MKANVTNLRKALKASAEAHNVKFYWWRNENQMALEGDSIPILSDVRMICKAFFGNAMMVELSYGYTVIWLDGVFRGEVDEALMYMALPYGTKLS